MKTHTITINGTDYELRITGTIGIQILAQSFVPDEADRYHTITDEEGEHQAPTPKWLMALLYAVFYTCHEHAAEKIDFVQTRSSRMQCHGTTRHTPSARDSCPLMKTRPQRNRTQKTPDPLRPFRHFGRGGWDPARILLPPHDIQRGTPIH